MCKDCGCGDHDHGHHHHHDDEDHDHIHDEHGRTILLERKILDKNDVAAEKNRQWLHERGVTTVNLISSPGAGKTYLLEKTLERLRDRVPCAVITGDQRTDNDARRLANHGAPVVQIETISSCHLAAEQIGEKLSSIVTEDVKLLFIENVGNLVCPSAFDLGEDFKIALLSVTEGEDKPLKYPSLFTQAPVAVLTKTDLIPHLDWDLEACRKNLRAVRPGVFVFELSARSGDGMEAWVDYLVSLAG